MVARRSAAFSRASEISAPSTNSARISSSTSASELDHLLAGGLGLGQLLGGDLHVHEHRRRSDRSTHSRLRIRHQVDDADEVVLEADGHLDRDGVGLQAAADLLDAGGRVGAHPVHLLMKAIRGTRYLSAWRQTVSDCGSTPPTAQNTATAPSSTRRLRSTSTVKSTWPGVSMMLTRWSRQKQVVAAAVMVMPRSCSCCHPVHDRGPVVDLAHPMGDAGVEQDALGSRGLARIDVRHDPDVSGLGRLRLTEPRLDWTPFGAQTTIRQAAALPSAGPP